MPTHSPLRECPPWGSQRGRPRDAVRDQVQRRPQEGTEDSQERRLTQGTAVPHGKCSDPTRHKCSGPHSLKGPRSGLTRAEGNFSEGLGTNPGSSDRTWACTEQVRWGRPQAKTQKQRKAGRTRGTASTVKGGWAGGVQVSRERRAAGFSARLTASLRATESHWGFKRGSVKIRLKCRHLTLGAVPGHEWRAGPSRRLGRSEGGPTRRAG